MAIIAIASYCPSRQEEKDHLAFWRMLGGKHFYICEECVARADKLTSEQLLRIGFSHSFDDHADQASRAQASVRDPYDLRNR